jgi:hypothetical protein
VSASNCPNASEVVVYFGLRLPILLGAFARNLFVTLAFNAKSQRRPKAQRKSLELRPLSAVPPTRDANFGYTTAATFTRFMHTRKLIFPRTSTN